MIYHITTQSRWDDLIPDAHFAPDMFAIEKFIHCCEERQITGVLTRYFKGVENLLLLHIDEKKLDAEIKYEPATNNELFPHVYGAINKNAIVQIQQIG